MQTKYFCARSKNSFVKAASMWCVRERFVTLLCCIDCMWWFLFSQENSFLFSREVLKFRQKATILDVDHGWGQRCQHCQAGFQTGWQGQRKGTFINKFSWRITSSFVTTLFNPFNDKAFLRKKLRWWNCIIIQLVHLRNCNGFRNIILLELGASRCVEPWRFKWLNQLLIRHIILIHKRTRILLNGSAFKTSYTIANMRMRSLL